MRRRRRRPSRTASFSPVKPPDTCHSIIHLCVTKESRSPEYFTFSHWGDLIVYHMIKYNSIVYILNLSWLEVYWLTKSYQIVRWSMVAPGGGGGGHSNMWPIRDVPLDKVCFLSSLSLRRYIYSSKSVLNRVWKCPRKGIVARLSSSISKQSEIGEAYPSMKQVISQH